MAKLNKAKSSAGKNSAGAVSDKVRLIRAIKPQARPLTLSELTDEELAALVRARNEQAFALIVQRYARKGHQLAYRVLLNHADAEEVMQDVFSRYWQRPEKWEPHRGARFSGWFYKVVLNAARDGLRRRDHTQTATVGEIDETIAHHETAERLVMHQQLLNIIIKNLKALPLRQREAIALCIFNDFSHQQAAEILDTSPKAVESLVGRARQQLRNSFKARG